MAFEHLLTQMRCERLLLEGEVDGLSTSDIRRLAMIAWEDPKLAHSFTLDLYRRRMERRLATSVEEAG